MSTKPAVSQGCNAQPCTQTVNMPYNTGWGAVTSIVINMPSQPRSVLVWDTCDNIGYLSINGGGWIQTGHDDGSSWCGVQTVGHPCKDATWSKRSCYPSVSQFVIGDNTIQIRCDDTTGAPSCGNSGIVVTY